MLVTLVDIYVHDVVVLIDVGTPTMLWIAHVALTFTCTPWIPVKLKALYHLEHLLLHTNLYLQHVQQHPELTLFILSGYQ